MKIKHYIVTILLCLVAGTGFAQEEKWGMNNPYIDDTPWHFGGQVGMVCSSLGITENTQLLNFKDNHGNLISDTVHVGTPSPGFGVRANFVVEYRICKYLSIRCSPGFEWHNIPISYRAVRGDTIGILYPQGAWGNGNELHLMRLPFNFPIFLKFNSERIGNFRPYIIAGGGISCDISTKLKKDINTIGNKAVNFNLLDYYCEVGFGIDLYLLWCKLSPEITYRIGFTPDPINRNSITPDYAVFNTPIEKLTNQTISLTFYFGN